MQRDYNIDILKSLGISLVILAHVSCPRPLFLLRSFDVPLMIFSSAFAYSGRSLPPLMSFYAKRILRLIIPVYVFYILYFVGAACLDKPLDVRTIRRTFLLMEGYGWIIRVFLLQMLIIPLFSCYLKNRGGRKGIFFSIMIYSIYELVVRMSTPCSFEIFSLIFFYMAGYGVVSYVGYNIKMARTHELVYWFVPWSLITVTYLIIGVHDPYASKYPPHGLFISYGISCCIFLYFTLKWISPLLLSVWNKSDKVWQRAVKNFIEFASKHVIWIYLWHIPMLDLMSYAKVEDWVLRYVLVYAGAVLCVFLQNFAVNCIARIIRKKTISSLLINYLT